MLANQQPSQSAQRQRARGLWLTFAMLALGLSVFSVNVYAAGMLHTSGRNIVDANNNVVRLRGFNLGGWFIMEKWMAPLDSGSLPDTYSVIQELDTRFGVATEQSLINTYQQSWITTADLDNIKNAGYNAVRVPVWWGQFYPLNNVSNAGWRSDAFTELDWLVNNCASRGIYVIIDMHGVVGGQSTSDDTGQQNQNAYWTNSNDQGNTAWMWWQIASHYNGNATVAGYDLLNEPDAAPSNAAVISAYNSLYQSVRSADPNHIIFIEGTFGSWDWSMLPDPSTEGWTNVVYEMHEYQWNNTTNPSGVDAGSQNQVNDFNNHASYNVPGYIGEFNDFGTGASTWQTSISDYDNAGLSWTMWSYKANAGLNPNSWGWFDPTFTPAIPNISTDSSSTISSDWQQWTTANAFTVNTSDGLGSPATVISEGPYGGSAAAIPGTVQAENYDVGGQGTGYSVNSTNGSANSYRSDGVDLETTSDTGGGYDLGWSSGGQWFRYTVNVASAGTYTVSFRVAAPSAVTDGFHISNSSGANLSGNVNVPATGGWQTWATVTATVNLSAGQQVLTLNEDNGGWNINYMSFASAGGAFGGSPAAIPGTVQAENYDLGGQGSGYSVSSVNGSANSYRSDGVDLETTSDTGGGYDVGWTGSGQWFHYTVNVASAGTYTVSFRIAAPSAVTDGFHLSNASGTNLSGNVNVPATGGWQTWATVTATVTLPAGQQVLTLNQDNGGWNINYMSFGSASNAFGGSPAAIPGTVQAENYDTGGQGQGYNVSSVNGSGNSYRSDGVDLETTTDTGGGYDLGWTASGQWFHYTVNVASAGTHTVSFRVAAPSAVTDGFHISSSSGANLSGNINVPATGGWQTWTTVTATVTLPAGQQVLTLNQDNGGWNINYFSFQ